MSDSPQINEDLLAMLRCPVAVRDKNAAGAGKLTVAHNGWWLVCEDNGYKYPVTSSGIPNMVATEGEKWVATAVEDLPVPPPEASL